MPYAELLGSDHVRRKKTFSCNLGPIAKKNLVLLQKKTWSYCKKNLVLLQKKTWSYCKKKLGPIAKKNMVLLQKKLGPIAKKTWSYCKKNMVLLQKKTWSYCKKNLVLLQKKTWSYCKKKLVPVTSQKIFFIVFTACFFNVVPHVLPTWNKTRLSIGQNMPDTSWVCLFCLERRFYFVKLSVKL